MSRDDYSTGADDGYLFPGWSSASYPGASPPANSNADYPQASSAQLTPNAGGGGSGGGGGSSTAAGGGVPVGGNPYGIESLTVGLDPTSNRMRVYGTRRFYDPTSGEYKYQTEGLGWADDLNGVSAASGIAVGALQGAVQQALVQYQQTQATATRLGQYQVLGRNDDSTLQVRDGAGNITNVSRAQIAAGAIPGVTTSDFDQAAAQAGQTQRTLTQMGQYTVAGANPDGSLQVRDFNGALSTVTAQQAASGAIPGVSYADFQRAQSEFVQNQRTLSQAGQFSIKGYDPATGAVTISDGRGNLSTVTAQDAASGKYPGISALEVQQTQQQGVQSQWNSANAFGPQFSGLPGGSNPPPAGTQPQQPPAPAPTTPPRPGPTPTADSPPPLPQPGGRPGMATGQTPAPAPMLGAPSVAGGDTAGPIRAVGLPGASTAGTLGAPSATAAVTPQMQAQMRATPLPQMAASTQGTGQQAVGVNASTAQQGMSNQQLDLTNRTYQNLSNYVRQGNIGSRNLSGMGDTALGRPQIAGVG